MGLLGIFTSTGELTTVKKSKQLFTEITSDGQLNISLTERDVPTPKPHEVIVRIEAAPINPSDMWPSQFSGSQL